jgi:hypothetical protein
MGAAPGGAARAAGAHRRHHRVCAAAVRAHGGAHLPARRAPARLPALLPRAPARSAASGGWSAEVESHSRCRQALADAQLLCAITALSLGPWQQGAHGGARRCASAYSCTLWRAWRCPTSATSRRACAAQSRCPAVCPAGMQLLLDVAALTRRLARVASYTGASPVETAWRPPCLTTDMC